MGTIHMTNISMDKKRRGLKKKKQHKPEILVRHVRRVELNATGHVSVPKSKTDCGPIEIQ